MEKKISVVVPTYKRPELLRKCLHALAGQQMDRNDFEIIVVSDGPDEQTRNMIHGLDHLLLPYVQYITLERNSGPAAARNAGWKKANSRLIAFTDDDCIPAPLWLASLWKAFISYRKPAYMAFTGKVVVPVSENPTDFELNTAHLQE